MSDILEVNNDNFEQEVVNEQKVTVVDFWATWCGPCRKLAPLLDEIAQEFGENVKFTKLNADENLDTAKKYSVSGLPTLLIFKNGEPKERLVGLMPRTTIVSKIKNCL